LWQDNLHAEMETAFQETWSAEHGWALGLYQSILSGECMPQIRRLKINYVNRIINMQQGIVFISASCCPESAFFVKRDTPLTARGVVDSMEMGSVSCVRSGTGEVV